MSYEPLSDRDPRSAGPFRLEARLGRARLGEVYLGRGADDTPVAVKIVDPATAASAGFRERFRREVSTQRAISGPGVAPVIDMDLDCDSPWVATAFVEGPDLADAVLRHGPMDPDRLHRTARGTLRALSSVHAAGLVHGDVQPRNVVIGPDGPVLVDFGVARAAGELSQAVGTQGYVAPELLTGGRLSPAADVFSWGAVVAFAGTGRQAFGSGSPDEVSDRVRLGRWSLEGLEAWLEQLVIAALDVDPDRRPGVAPLLSALGGPKQARAGTGR